MNRIMFLLLFLCSCPKKTETATPKVREEILTEEEIEELPEYGKKQDNPSKK